MKRWLFLAFFAVFPALLMAQTVTMTASHLQNASGQMISGYVYLQPTLTSGQPTWYRTPGGGTVSSAAVPVPVTNGALSVTLPDTTQTYPANICFTMSYPQGSLATGYNCLQPHTTAYNSSDWCQSGVCNLDNYLPGNQPLPTINAVGSINYTAGNLTFTGSGFSQSGNTFTFPAGAGLSLTTTGASGASTLASGILNIPQYAGSGSNSDITSLTGLTTPLSVLQGGTGQNSLVPTTPVTTAPSGSCAQGAPNQQVISTGTQYSCQNVVSGVGTWGTYYPGVSSDGANGLTVTGNVGAATLSVNSGGTIPSGAVIIKPSGDTTGATDGAAIQAACALGETINLTDGTYYVGGSNSTISISTKPCTILGNGPSQTILQNEGTTDNVFTVSVGNVIASPALLSPGSEIGEFSIVQDQSVTPTGGYAIEIGSGVSGPWTYGFVFDNLFIQGTYGGIYTTTGFSGNWLDNILISKPVSGNAIYYDTPSPGGDAFFLDDHVWTGDVVIHASDTTLFDGLKINNGNLTVGDNTDASVSNLRISNSSIEQGVIDFSQATAANLGLIQIANTETEGGVDATAAVSRLRAVSLCPGSTTGACIELQQFLAAYDTFSGSSGAELTTRPASTGQSWINYNSVAGGAVTSILNGFNGVHPSSTGSSFYYLNYTPNSTNNTVTMWCYSSGAGSCGVLSHINGTVATYYELLYTPGTGVQLFKVSSGTSTQLGSTDTTVISGSPSLGLKVDGVTVQGFVNGIADPSLNATDSSPLPNGYSGMTLTNSANYGFDFGVQ